MIYGYVRVSSNSQRLKGNSLEEQKKLLIQNGVDSDNIIEESKSAKNRGDRPEFNKLIKMLKPGDKLIVTKIDRFARSLIEGETIVDNLIQKDVMVNILNIGVMDNTPASKLIRQIFFGFAEFERAMIEERTLEGKLAKMEKCDDATLGRPKKFKKAQREHALELLETKSYTEVSEITGISRRTLIRYMNEKREKEASLEPK